jgi:hypothetical protein
MFYDGLGKPMGDMEDSTLDDDPNKEMENFKLSNKHLKDIKDYAEELRTVLKEKYLGRLPGQKRGESNAAYAGQLSFLTSLLGVAMLGFLGYLHYQLKSQEKNKVF